MDVRSFALAVTPSSSEGRRLSGRAMVFGRLVETWWPTVVAPGAFDGCAERFLKEGFTPDSHGWDYAGVVAMPTKFEPDADGVEFECEFHSTPDAEAVLTKCKERMDKGLAVGFSLSFAVGAYEWYEDGATMVDALDAQGRMRPQYETDQIRDVREEVELITVASRVYECSVVPVPAVPGAFAEKVFSVGKGPLVQMADSALAAVEVVAQRMESVAGMRGAEGRRLGAESRARAAQLAERLSRLAAPNQGPDHALGGDALSRALVLRAQTATL